MFHHSYILDLPFSAVGCTSGTMYLVDSVTLLNQLSDAYRYAHDAITHIAFSHNSTYFATAVSINFLFFISTASITVIMMPLLLL